METEDKKHTEEITSSDSTTSENSENPSLTPKENKTEENAKNELLYLKAEFDNYRKRMIREQSEAIKFANKNILSEATGLVDLLDQALRHAEKLKKKNDADFNNFLNGIELTRKEFDHFFSRFSLSLIGTIGEKFDPEKHEAISQENTSDDKVDTITAVVQKGCALNGKLVKPARVVVGKKAE